MLRHPDSNRDELSSSTHLRFDIPIIECYVYHSAMSQCFPTSTWTGLFTLKRYHELFTLTGFYSRERSDGSFTTLKHLLRATGIILFLFCFTYYLKSYHSRNTAFGIRKIIATPVRFNYRVITPLIFYRI